MGNGIGGEKEVRLSSIYLTVGHTKFAPDQLFSSIAKTFYNSDVLSIEMLHQITQQYATSLVFTSRLMQHCKTALEQKYTAILEITEMHDISVSKLRLGKTTVTQRRVCCNGEYIALRKYKYNAEQSLPDISSYEPVVLSAEKICQLGEQHRIHLMWEDM